MKKDTYMQRMSYESFDYAIKKSKEKCGKSRFLLGLDLLHSYLTYGADFIDYYMLGFYGLSSKQKKTYITFAKNDEYIRKYNDKKYVPIIEERTLFNEKFQDYLERDFLIIDDNYDEFVTFLKDKKEIYAKTNGKNNKRIKKITLKGLKPKELFSGLKNRGYEIIEEVLPMDPTLLKRIQNEMTSVHFVTLFANADSFLVTAFLKIDGKNPIVAPIDLDTGKVRNRGCDSDLNLYENFPGTSNKIDGTKIPYFEEAKKMVLSAAKELPRLCYVDFNVFIGIDGPALMSGTATPNYSFYQFPFHSGKEGLIPVMEEILKNEK